MDPFASPSEQRMSGFKQRAAVPAIAGATIALKSLVTNQGSPMLQGLLMAGAAFGADLLADAVIAPESMDVLTGWQPTDLTKEHYVLVPLLSGLVYAGGDLYLNGRENSGAYLADKYAMNVVSGAGASVAGVYAKGMLRM